MSFTILIFWLLNITTETVGQVAFKAGALKEEHHAGSRYFLNILSNKWIIIGVCCYVVEIFLWLSFLSLLTLSNAFLLCSFNIVTIAFAGRYFFGETMTGYRLIGILLITFGVILVGMDI